MRPVAGEPVHSAELYWIHALCSWCKISNPPPSLLTPPFFPLYPSSAPSHSGLQSLLVEVHSHDMRALSSTHFASGSRLSFVCASRNLSMIHSDALASRMQPSHHPTVDYQHMRHDIYGHSHGHPVVHVHPAHLSISPSFRQPHSHVRTTSITPPIQSEPATHISSALLFGHDQLSHLL